MNFLTSEDVAVKICGITTEEDARMCIAAGADAIGFNFYPGSSRVLDPDVAIPWIRDLPDAAARVAVVVNATEPLLETLRAAACFDVIQFHGDESPAACEGAGFPHWIKAIRVSDLQDLDQTILFNSPNILFDGWNPQAYGGTGQRLDWDLLRRFVAGHQGRRFILAGGLNAQNVRQAIRIVRPHAVDVASGVELQPGHKEEYLVREFIRAVKKI